MPEQIRRWRSTALLTFLLIGAVLALGWIWRGGMQTAQAPGSAKLQCALPTPASNDAYPGMVWVPAGNLAFGDTLYPEEQPLHDTQVAGFWMDRTEVRNDEFAAFVKATGYVTVAERPVDPAQHPGLPPEMRLPGAVVFTMPNATDGSGRLTQWWRYVPGANWRHPAGPQSDIAGRGAFPVVAVAYEDALAYARWKGRDLPSEAQWEWAARAGKSGTPDHDQPAEANTWQGLFPVANSSDDGFVGLAPAGCYPANAYGLFDMIGNVWEITADRWTPDHGADASNGNDPAQAPTRITTAGQHVIKGGSFLCAPNYCMRYRAGARQPQDDDLGASHLGFRTVRNATGP